MTPEKKLALKKETLTELAGDDLRRVVGAGMSGFEECSLPTRACTEGCTETYLTCHCP